MQLKRIDRNFNQQLELKMQAIKRDLESCSCQYNCTTAA